MYKVEWRDSTGKKYKRRLYEKQATFERYWSREIDYWKAMFKTQLLHQGLGVTITAYRLEDEKWHEFDRYPKPG